MDTLNKTNNDIYNLNKYEKLLFIYKNIENDKRVVPQNEKEEQEFLNEIKQNATDFNEIKAYCGRLLDYMEQRQKSFKNLLDSITD